jgi:hypothetical protein
LTGSGCSRATSPSLSLPADLDQREEFGRSALEDMTDGFTSVPHHSEELHDLRSRPNCDDRGEHSGARLLGIVPGPRRAARASARGPSLSSHHGAIGFPMDKQRKASSAAQSPPTGKFSRDLNAARLHTLIVNAGGHVHFNRGRLRHANLVGLVRSLPGVSRSELRDRFASLDCGQRAISRDGVINDRMRIGRSQLDASSGKLNRPRLPWCM